MASRHAGGRLKRGAKIAGRRGLAASAGSPRRAIPLRTTNNSGSPVFDAFPSSATVPRTDPINSFTLKNSTVCSIRHFFLLHYLRGKKRAVPLHHQNKKRSVRLGVRTVDFHSTNRGSIPLRTTRKPISRPEMGFMFFQGTQSHFSTL